MASSKRIILPCGHYLVVTVSHFNYDTFTCRNKNCRKIFDLTPAQKKGYWEECNFEGFENKTSSGARIKKRKETNEYLDF